MHVVAVVFEAVAGHESDLEGALITQARDSLDREEGRLRFDVARDPARKGRFYLYEIYRTRADFDVHLASPHFLRFDKNVGPWTLHKTVEHWALLANGGNPQGKRR
jgi:autoinducer 2-degrading protein